MRHPIVYIPQRVPHFLRMVWLLPMHRTCFIPSMLRMTFVLNAGSPTLMLCTRLRRGCVFTVTQVGSVIIALNGPQESSAATIKEFQHMFLSLGFIVFASIVILSALTIIFFVAPRYVFFDHLLR